MLPICKNAIAPIRYLSNFGAFWVPSYFHGNNSIERPAKKYVFKSLINLMFDDGGLFSKAASFIYDGKPKRKILFSLKSGYFSHNTDIGSHIRRRKPIKNGLGKNIYVNNNIYTRKNNFILGSST